MAKSYANVNNGKQFGFLVIQLAPPLVVMVNPENPMTSMWFLFVLSTWTAVPYVGAFEPVNWVQLAPWFAVNAVAPYPVTTPYPALKKSKPWGEKNVGSPLLLAAKLAPSFVVFCTP